jgi:C_GCAxxG_C_C family probable redox protein
MTTTAGQEGAASAPVERARVLFLDDAHPHGCAETTFVALKEAFGLPDPDDASPAMALNGGVAWSGGVCGAVTGAALAVGGLAASRTPDHATAKGIAREVVAGLIDGFEAEFGAVDCRALLGLEIRTPEAHAAFIESGIWRTACLRQIEFAVERLAGLAGDARLTSPAGDPRPATGPGSAPLGGGGQEEDDGTQQRHDAAREDE